MKWRDNNMYLNELMKNRHMTRAELCEKSGIPESTLRGILTGKTQIERCEVLTLYCIAEVLDTTVEEIINACWDESLKEDEPERTALHDRTSMIYFYRTVELTKAQLLLHNDISFVEFICKGKWIEKFYSGGFFRCALFLLGLIDHICNKHGQKRKAQFDEYRSCFMDEAVYPLHIVNKLSDQTEFTKAIKQISEHAVPELAEFHIFMTMEDIAPLSK